MTIKNTAVATSMLLAMGLSSPVFAETKTQPEVLDGDTVTIECITQAEVDLMTDVDKANLKLPVCEDVEKSEDGVKTTQ